MPFNTIIQNAPKKRIFGLDILRCIAILMVVYVHSVNILAALIPHGTIGKIIGKSIAFTFLFGHFGVEIFFALSGYLIGIILIKDYNNSGNFSFKNVISFWRRRWLRTLPLYLAVLITLSICFTFFDINYFLFLQNFKEKITNGFFLESWSLSVEEWSYIFCPLLLLPMSHLLPQKKVIPVTILVTILTGWILRIYLICKGVEDIRTIVIARLDAISYGIGIAYLMSINNNFLIKYKQIVFKMSLILLFLLYIFLRLSFAPFDLSKKFLLYKYFDLLFGLPLINICTALMIPFLISKNFNWNIRIKSFIIFISKISYSIYLWHFSFLYIFILEKNIHWKNFDPNSIFLVFISYWICTILFSFLSYKYIEQPFLRLRDYKISKIKPHD